MIEFFVATPRGKGGIRPHGPLKAIDGRIIEGVPTSCVGKKLKNYPSVTFEPARRCNYCHEIKEEIGFVRRRGLYTNECKRCCADWQNKHRKGLKK